MLLSCKHARVRRGSIFRDEVAQIIAKEHEHAKTLGDKLAPAAFVDTPIWLFVGAEHGVDVRWQGDANAGELEARDRFSGVITIGSLPAAAGF